MVFLHAILFVALTFSSHLQNSYSDGWTKKSTLRITERVEIPGMVLEPGTYIVNLESGTSRRSIVQIQTADGSRVVARLTAVPDYRARENMFEDVFTYHQVKASGPKVMQSWYYPGDLNGLEFVYPKERARQLAKATDTHVVASNGKDVKESAIVAVTPTGVEVVLDEAPQTDVARQKPKP